MKVVYLVRHAKSSWDDHSLRDFDRPLNERGKRDAPRMGKRLKEREIMPNLMLSSPAVRALTTCKEIADILGYDENRIKTDKRIYHASEEDLLHILQELNENHKSVMLFGHNPGLTDFANQLFNERIMNIPTCGIVAGKLNLNNWKEAKPGCGKMQFFDFPKKHKKKPD